MDWKIGRLPKKFNEDAKDQVVRLVDDRILAEYTSLQEAWMTVAPNSKSHGHSPTVDVDSPTRRKSR